MKKYILLLVVGLTLLSPVLSGGRADHEDAGLKLSAVEVSNAFVRQYPEAEVLSVVLKKKDDNRWVYEIEGQSPEHWYSLAIDANSGERVGIMKLANPDEKVASALDVGSATPVREVLDTNETEEITSLILQADQDGKAYWTVQTAS